MARCVYCGGRNSVRYEEYPEITIRELIDVVRVSPPPGVRDRGVTQEVRRRITIVESQDFQICKRCGAIWSGPANKYGDYTLIHNPSIDPSEYASFRRKWYEALRRYGLNLSPRIQK